MSNSNDVTTTINPGPRAERLTLPPGGQAQGLSANNPSGYNLLILDGSRVVYSIPPQSVVTLPVDFNGGSWFARLDNTQRAAGTAGSDSVVRVTLSPHRFPASNASLQTASSTTYSLLYTATGAGTLDAQLSIPAGYKRRIVLGVQADVQGLFFGKMGSLSMIDGTTPADQTVTLQTAAPAGVVNCDPFPACDSYAFAMSGAGTVLIVLEGSPGAAAVQIRPHGAQALSSLSLGGNSTRPAGAVGTQ